MADLMVQVMVYDETMTFYDFLIFWEAQPGAGMGLILDQGRGSAWTRDGAHLGPIWGSNLRNPFRGIGRGPGTHLEAEGRHFGGRRPTLWRPKAD